jgi:C1A family cysteine protease
MNHCIQLVGYSINNTDPSQSYWLARNSWDVTWGMNGYIQMEFNYSINTCGMADQATNVIIAKEVQL